MLPTTLKSLVCSSRRVNHQNKDTVADLLDPHRCADQNVSVLCGCLKNQEQNNRAVPGQE